MANFKAIFFCSSADFDIFIFQCEIFMIIILSSLGLFSKSFFITEKKIANQVADQTETCDEAHAFGLE